MNLPHFNPGEGKHPFLYFLQRISFYFAVAVTAGILFAHGITYELFNIDDISLHEHKKGVLFCILLKN